MISYWKNSRHWSHLLGDLYSIYTQRMQRGSTQSNNLFFGFNIMQQWRYKSRRKRDRFIPFEKNLVTINKTTLDSTLFEIPKTSRCPAHLLSCRSHGVESMRTSYGPGLGSWGLEGHPLRRGPWRDLLGFKEATVMSYREAQVREISRGGLGAVGCSRHL